MQKIKILQHPLLGQTAHFGVCPPKIGFFRGLGVVPKFSPPVESYYFCELGVHAKFQNCSTNISRRNGPFWLLFAKIVFLEG